MSGVYEGLTVVELADRRNQWAGKLLADGGARVIQIEPPGGSPGRWCGPFVDDKVDPDRCLDYWWYNTGKQSVALDIGAQAGAGLAAAAAGPRRRLPREHAAGHARGARPRLRRPSPANRALIYASLTDFGQDGPWRDLPDERRRPPRPRRPDGEHGLLGSDASRRSAGRATRRGTWAASFVLHGITLALFDRMTTGEGQYIDVSIHDACAIGTEAAVPQWMYYGATMYRQTGMHANARAAAGPRNCPPPTAST